MSVQTQYVQYTAQQFFDTMVARYNGEAIARGKLPVDTDAGTQLGAIIWAIAWTLAIEVQAQTVANQQIARVGSSQGDDIDTFYEPLGVPRTKASLATGPLTFSTPSNVTGDQTIGAGTIVTDGAGSKVVLTADAIILDGTNTIDTTATALIQGITGNFQIHTLNTIYGSISTPTIAGLSVTNNTAWDNGIDRESDDAYRARAQMEVSSPRGGTARAIIPAVLGIQPGLTAGILDYFDEAANPFVGFTLAANTVGATGALASGLLDAVKAVVLEKHGAGMKYRVVSSSVTNLAIAATLTLDGSVPPADVEAAAAAALTAYVNGLGIDYYGGPVTMPYGRIWSILYGLAGVTLASGVTLNGGGVDVVAAFPNQFALTSITITTI